MFYSYGENIIYYVTEDLNVYALANDSVNALARWKTPELSEGDVSTIKHYRKVQFSDRVNQVDVYVDNDLIKTVTNKKEFFMPSGCFGTSIQFDIQTDKEIKSVKYEYGVLHD
jgi:hypothetical protein